jgi:hypothetical protein
MQGTLLCHLPMRFKARPYENEHEIIKLSSENHILKGE